MIETLNLTDFRNHTMCRITTGGRRNIIITGPNGAGKTAILEALSMLSGERGMRGASMPDIARFGGNGGFAERFLRKREKLRSLSREGIYTLMWLNQ